MNTMQGTRFVLPEQVVTHFHIRPGETVADLGAGSGYFLPVLARAVGREGTLYCLEIQKNLVETLGALAREQHLNNVRVLWGDLESVGGSKIPDGAVDVAVLVNTLFQIDDKETAVSEIDRLLRTGGRVFVIDWTESFGGLGPQPGDVLSEHAARALFESRGYVYEHSFPSGEHHYGIMMRKP